MGTYVYLCLIHIVVRQRPIQHCKAIILHFKINQRVSLVAQTVKNLPAMQETGFSPWVGKILLEKGITHSSILAQRIPWTEKPGRLQAMGSQSWT